MEYKPVLLLLASSLFASHAVALVRTPVRSECDENRRCPSPKMCCVNGVCHTETIVCNPPPPPPTLAPGQSPGDNSGDDRTQPRRGSQCKYGVSQSHSFCLEDSPKLIQLESASKREIVERHNYYRGLVNPAPKTALPNLKWDDDLALEAERWAAQCKFEHSTAEQRALPARGGTGAWDWVGQNLCTSSNNDMSWTECIDMWASEVNNWRYGTGAIDESKAVGHYTQIIWADTLYVGCGKSRCSSESYDFENQLVCHYAPGGNLNTGEGAYAKPYERA